MNKFTLTQILRPLLGILLIAFLVSRLNQTQLIGIISKAHWQWFVLGLISLIVSNLCSVWRWQIITMQIGLSIRFAQALLLYAQGVTANTILPGGIVGGDVWRTLGLVKLARKNKFSHADAAASVLLDRVGGLWSLCVFSLLASILLVITSLKTITPLQGNHLIFNTYLLILLLASLLPWLFTLVPRLFKSATNAAYLTFSSEQVANKWLRNLLRTLSIISRHIYLLFSTFSQSLLVQIFAVFAFYACLQAVNVELSYTAVAAVSLAIFLSAIIPASISGFGARELAAVMVLGLLGVNAESAFSASFLYGLGGTVQGILGIYFWLKKEPDSATI